MLYLVHDGGTVWKLVDWQRREFINCQYLHCGGRPLPIFSGFSVWEEPRDGFHLLLPWIGGGFGVLIVFPVVMGLGCIMGTGEIVNDNDLWEKVWLI